LRGLTGLTGHAGACQPADLAGFTILDAVSRRNREHFVTFAQPLNDKDEVE
jgi:hypothetical protein